MNKECTICHEVKPLGAFYNNSKMTGGYLNQCKVCKLKYQKSYAKTDAGKEAASRRSKKPERVKYQTANTKKWRENNPEKYAAHNMINNGLRDGKLEKPLACDRCGKEDMIHGHHDDYSQPMDVEWICVSCHGTEHPNYKPMID